ncbi:unnamed protein product [Ambrosiozyma monospora]|uniref:Unnamed protein product n=1 Tax=Ambrosiozyma monospora TaxID=43982 RepID=A0ACB5SWB9_AMBMO|nr:unnamed protein product [Ambrosiozyma monospora]
MPPKFQLAAYTTQQFEEPLTTTATYTSLIPNVVERNLLTIIYNTDDEEVVAVNGTPTTSRIVSSTTESESPSVTSNALAKQWATVMAMESILGDPSLYIFPGDNETLTSVLGSYQDYSAAITYHPGYMFVLNDTQKTSLYEFYKSLYTLFDTDVFYHITKLISVKYSEFDSLTIPVTLPSGASTALNGSVDSMVSTYYSMALGNVLYADIESSFELKYRAVLNTNNNTSLMRRAYGAFTSFHNQQFDENPVSIWSVFDEFLSELPWGPQLRNIVYSSYSDLTTGEYTHGSVTLIPSTSSINTDCQLVTDQYSPVNETTYFPLVFVRNSTYAFQNRSFGQGPIVTTFTNIYNFKTMIHVSPVTTGSACNVVSERATMTYYNTTGIIQCGVMALAADSIYNGPEFMEVMKKKQTQPDEL